MTALKQIACSLIAFLATQIASGQTAKEYFIPDSAYNKAIFYMPDNKTGEPTSAGRTLYYVKKKTGYDITDAHSFAGETGSIQTRTVQISANEVKMTQEVNTSVLGVTNKKTVHNPAVILFKLPPSGQTVSWTTTQGKALNTCTASWTIVTIDGKSKKAIKIKRVIQGFKAYYAEYYVKGIGLWQMDIVSENGTAQTSDKFDELSYDPTATEEAEADAKSSNYSLISKYEKFVISGQKPTDANVQTKYDDRDYRGIFWSDKLTNASTYIRQEIEKLGYEYVKVTVNDRQHITYAYRNCKKNLLLDVTEWYNIKISLAIQWFSNSVKPSIGYLMWCDR